MIGAIIKGAIRGGFRGGRRAASLAGTGAGMGASGVANGLLSFGRGSGTVGTLAQGLFNSHRAGQIAQAASGGALRWGAAGGGMALLTGNADWIPLMAGMGAYRGGGKKLIGTRNAKNFKGKGFDQVLGGMFAPGRMTRNFALGGAVGVMEDNPNYAVYGVAGLPAAKWALKTQMNPMRAGKAGLGMMLAPFSPRGAMRAWRGMGALEVGAGAGAIGAGVGLGAAYYKNRTGGGNDVTSGYFPGGVMPLGSGGRGIPNNHLNTEGLTLALHKNGRRTRHM